MTTMEDSGSAPLYRLGGAMAGTGAAVGLVGNALHPRSVGYYGDPVAWLDHNTGNGIWFASHLLLILGAILIVGGPVALSRSLAGTRGYGVGQLALAYTLVGSALYLTTLAVDGLAVPKLADVWTADSSSSADAVLAGSILYETIFSLLYVFMINLFGLTPLLYGAAILLGRTYAPWLGWGGIVAGTSVIVTGILSMVGVATEVLDALVWPVVSSLFAFWLIATGILLWRRARA